MLQYIYGEYKKGDVIENNLDRSKRQKILLEQPLKLKKRKKIMGRLL